MPGYSQPCRYCDKIVPPDSGTCPYCGKVNPAGPLRCPKCHSPIQNGFACCSTCGLVLRTTCPECFKLTFFGDYCEYCQARLQVICANPSCRTPQPPIGEVCCKCGKPIK